MASGMIGMDVVAAKELAARLARWSLHAEQALITLLQAEQLADIPSGATRLISQVSADGTATSGAILRAAAALESFTITIDSPFAIAAAVASVKGLDGEGNSPELHDRRRTPSRLVRSNTASQAEAALVMAQLLAEDASDVRFRDTTAVVAARSELLRLADLEAQGAISSNDSRIDHAFRKLRTELEAHASSPMQVDQLVKAVIVDQRTDTLTLLASVIEQQPVASVALALEHDLDYAVADQVLRLRSLDRLTSLLQRATGPATIALARDRDLELRAMPGIQGQTQRDMLARALNRGESAADAFGAVHADRSPTFAEHDQTHALVRGFGFDATTAAGILAGVIAPASRGAPDEQSRGAEVVEDGHEQSKVGAEVVEDGHEQTKAGAEVVEDGHDLPVAPRPTPEVLAMFKTGDGMHLSEGELNAIAAHISEATVTERNALIHALTPTQLARLFHNVDTTGFFSNDWNDKQRADFYTDLVALTPATQEYLGQYTSHFVNNQPTPNPQQLQVSEADFIDRYDQITRLDLDEFLALRSHLWANPEVLAASPFSWYADGCSILGRPHPEDLDAPCLLHDFAYTNARLGADWFDRSHNDLDASELAQRWKAHSDLRLLTDSRAIRDDNWPAILYTGVTLDLGLRRLPSGRRTFESNYVPHFEPGFDPDLGEWDDDPALQARMAELVALATVGSH